MKNFKTFLILLAFLGLSFNSARAQNIPVDGITFESTHWEEDGSGGGYISIAVGETAQLWIYISPQNATIQGVTVESSNPEVFAVLPDFAILGLSEGEEFITVRSLDPSYTEELTINVKVRKIPVENISFQFSHSAGGDGYNMKIMEGDIGTIYFFVTPYDATIQEITVESSNPEIVNVSILYDGKRIKVFTYNTGNAVLTIRSKDPSYTEEHIFNIEVLALEQGDMFVSPDVMTLETTDYGWVAAFVESPYQPFPIHVNNVTWSISESTVASIEENGTILAISPGEAIITATAPNGVTATCNLTVVRKPPPKPVMPKIILVSGALESGNLNGSGDIIVQAGSTIRIICDSEDAKIKYTLDNTDPTTSSNSYPASGAKVITINQNTVVRAIALRDDGFLVSYSNEILRDFKVRCKPPNSHPPVSITLLEYGTKVALYNHVLQNYVGIRYTLDGSEPNETSTLFTEWITLDESISQDGQNRRRIKAKAFKEGFIESATATFDYPVKVNTPKIVVDTRALSCSTPGAQIRYTTDGSYPVPTSPLYTEPFDIPTSGKVDYKARAFKNGFTASDIISFTLNARLRTPHTFNRQGAGIQSPATFMVINDHEVKLRSIINLQPAAIYYTTDGSEPTESSTRYHSSNPVIISPHYLLGTTLKAKAFRTGYPESETAVFTYFRATPPSAPTVNIPSGSTVNFDTEVYPSAEGANGFYYTTDGSEPKITCDNDGSLLSTNGNFTPATGSIRIRETCTLKIRAVKYTSNVNSNYRLEGPVASFTYTVLPASVDVEINDMEYDISDDIRIVGGKLVNLVLNSISTSLHISNGVYKMAIGNNFAIGANNTERDAKFVILKNFLIIGDRNCLKTVITPITKSASTAGASSLMEITGYLEGSRNNLNGYFMVYAEAIGNWEEWMVFLNVGCHLKGYVKYWGGTQLNFNTSPKFTKPQSTLQYGLEAKLSAGVGVPLLASVGVFGSASFHHKWDMVHNYNLMWLEGKFGVYEKFLWKRFDQTLLNGTKQIWKTFPSIRSDETEISSDEWFMPKFFDFSKYEFMPRKVSSEWMGTSTLRGENETIKSLRNSVYSETAPFIAEADGKRIMVFLSDESSRDDFNRTVLMYSVYNSSTNTWSTPQAVNDNGTADFYPNIASNGANIWVTWQRSNTTFGPNVEIEDIFAAGEIAVASFNNSTETFNTATVLTNNDFMDTHPRVVFHAGASLSPFVVWIQNPENDVFGTNGANRIMTCWRNPITGWQNPVILKDNLGAILDLNVSYFEGKYQIAYITDNDNDLETLGDRNLIVIDDVGAVMHTPVTNKMVSGIRFTSIDNNKALVWFEEGRLRYMTESGQTYNLTAEQDMFTDNYKVFDNGTKTSVVYPYLEDEVGYICVREYEDGLLGNQFKLAKTGGYPNYFDGVLESTGEFNIVFNNSIMSFDEDDELQEENDLLLLKIAPKVNIKLKDIFYLSEDVKLGEPLEVKLDIENIGGFAVNDILVKVNGVEMGQYPVGLKTGEKIMLDFSFIVPSNMKSVSLFDISVEPVGMTGVKSLNENSFTIALGYTNFLLTLDTEYTLIDPEIDDEDIYETEYSFKKMLTVTANVTNYSDFAAEAILQVRRGTPDGTVIEAVELGNIAGWETITSEMTFDVETIVPDDEYYVRVYFEVVTDAQTEFSFPESIIIYREENLKIMSGSVYEMVEEEAQAISDVIATCWIADDENGTNARIWEGNEDDEEFINPQFTDQDGYFTWSIAEGWWQVRLKKEGYYDAQSEWMPAQRLLVDLEMTKYSSINPDKIDDNSIVIYPNPTKGQLRITNYGLQIENIEIFDVIGRNVETWRAASLQNGTINISHLPSGFYFVKIKTDKGTFTAKVVKN